MNEGRKGLEIRSKNQTIYKEVWKCDKEWKGRDKVWSPNLLSDKYTQVDSSQISLVQVDLEQIKYTIQPTFLDQIEMQVNR